MILTDPEIESFSLFAGELAEAAGNAVTPYFRTHMAVKNKGGLHFDPVTPADKFGERTMRAIISRRFPEHGIYGEEEGHHVGSSPFTWILDPIDATRAFITGLPLWGTLIALHDGENPRIGVMNQPFTRERFLGTPKGAWLNGKSIRVRPCATLAEAKIACTSLQTAEQLADFRRIADQARMSRYDGDCYAYCMLACGHIDAVIGIGLKPCTIQALIPIIQSAGGLISTWDGQDPQNGGAILACGDRRLHVEIASQLKQFSA